MRRRPFAAGAALLAAVGAGALITLAVRGTPTAAVPRPASIATATVVRTDLVSTVLTGGTLGYAPTDPVVNQLNGTYTAVLPAGTSVAAGQTLYRVDNQPIVLMTGSVPAWRPFDPGMTDGPDVAQLEANLIALGYARGLFTVAGPHFSSLTADALMRWQSANGYPATGQVPWGVIVFLPTSVLVDAPEVAVGQPARPGDAPYVVSTASRIVTVPVNPNLPTVAVGEAVSIVLPDNATTPGTVTAIGLAPPASGASNTGSSGSSSGASTVLSVTPTDPAATGTGTAVGVQVSLTTQSVSNVLAVPVTALLALAGGGYGVEVVDHAGRHHLTGVTTGAFAGGRVQVSGAGIGAGTKVVVAQ